MFFLRGQVFKFNEKSKTDFALYFAYKYLDENSAED